MDSFVLHASAAGMHSLCTRWQVVQLPLPAPPPRESSTSRAYGTASSDTLLLTVRIAACPPQSRRGRRTMEQKTNANPQWLSYSELARSRIVALLETFLARNRAAFRILSLRRINGASALAGLQDAESMWWTVTVKPSPCSVATADARLVLHIHWVFLAWQPTLVDRPLKKRRSAGSPAPPTPNPSPVAGDVRIQLASDVLPPDLEELLWRSLSKLCPKVWTHPLLKDKLHSTWVERLDASAWALGRLAHHLAGWGETCIRLPAAGDGDPLLQTDGRTAEPQEANHALSWCISEDELSALLHGLDRATANVKAVQRPALDMQDFALAPRNSSDEHLDPLSSDSPRTSSPTPGVVGQSGLDGLRASPWSTSSECGPLGLDEMMRSSPQPLGLGDACSTSSRPADLDDIDHADGAELSAPASPRPIGLGDMGSDSSSEPHDYLAASGPSVPSSGAPECAWYFPLGASWPGAYVSTSPSSPPRAAEEQAGAHRWFCQSTGRGGAGEARH